MDNSRKQAIRKKVDDQMESARTKIAEALEKAGHVVSRKDDLRSWVVDDEFIPIQLKADSAGDVWYSTLTGGVRIIVGEYGQKKQFPIKKDGSFRLDDIVSLVSELIQQKRHSDAAGKERAARHTAAVEVKNRLVHEFYGEHTTIGRRIGEADHEEAQVPKEERVHLTASADGLSLEVYDLTEEQARRLIQTCKDIGLVGSKP